MCSALLPPSPTPGLALNPTLEQVLQGSGRISIPGSVQKISRCGTSLYGLVVTVILSQKFDLMILEDFSNINDSMIHFLCSYSGAV